MISYNSYLFRRFNYHINVEICSFIIAIKHVHKYVYKNINHIIIHITIENNFNHQNVFNQSIDKIDEYVFNQYIDSCQIVWNIFEFKNHYEKFSMMFLNLHLSNQQSIYYRNDIVFNEKMRDWLNQFDFILITWFKYNFEHQKKRHILYYDFSIHYVYNFKKKTRHWNSRKKNHRYRSNVSLQFDQKRNFLFSIVIC